ncbi:hypothetical protein AN216_14325 [Streptomyces oceani]|uniref:DNA primase DnaG DnaB-binding domain-containing protein n=1 Tax=Streptomyces oceani TaxID=1075402 RepID=A0A1E7KFG5_9ACTN|nr:hypothetical protein AN216_14325 [Streptomyces oceani]
MLKLALQRPELVAPAFDAYAAAEFTAESYALVRTAVAAAGGVTGADRDYLPRVRDAAPDDRVRGLITELTVEPLRTTREADEVYAGEQLIAVRLAAVDARVAELESSARRMEARRDFEGSAPVREQLWTLQQYGRGLRERGAAAL